MKTLSLNCRKALALAGAITLSLSPPARAAVIAEDAFEGGALNTLVGQTGGTGWAGPWTAGAGNAAHVVDTTGNSLRFNVPGGASISGNDRAVELSGTVNQITVTRQLAPTLPDTFYAAYLVRVTAGSWTDTDTLSLHFGNSASSTANPNFGLRGPDLFMVRTGTGTPVAGASNVINGATALGVTSYLVARFSKLDGAGNPTATYDRIELWVNPARCRSPWGIRHPRLCWWWGRCR